MALRAFLLLALGFGLVLLLLRRANLARVERYRQLWLAVAAVALWALALLTFSLFEDGVRAASQPLASTISSWVLHTAGPATPALGLLVLNGLVLIGFLALKTAGLWLLGLTGRRHADAGQPAEVGAGLAYDWDASRGAILQADWVFPGRVLRWATVAGFALLLVAIWDAVVQPLPWAVPGLVALPLLVLAEWGWYLGGPEPEWRRGSITVAAVDPLDRGSFQALWERYQRIWPDHVLAASNRFRRSTAETYQPAGRPDGVRGQEIDDVWRMVLRRFGRTLFQHGDYELLTRLWSDEDLLIDDAPYDRLAPLLFASLQRDLLNGQGVLLLVEPRLARRIEDGTKDGPDLARDSRQVIEWIRSWFRSLYGSAIDVQTYLDYRAQSEPRLPQVMVAAAGDLLRLGAVDKAVRREVTWFDTVRTIVVLDAAPAVFNHIMPTGTWLEILRDRLRVLRGVDRPFRCIVLSDYRHQIESSIRRNLPVHPHEQSLFRLPTDHVHAIIWRAEAAPWYQQALLATAADDYLGIEPVLALPAWEEGVPTIQLVEQRRLPVEELIEHLDIHRGQILPNGPVDGDRLRESASSRLVRDAQIPWLQPIEDRPMLLVRDRRNNCINAVRVWMAHGRGGTFVHVIAPPYLLRDYLADNADFFMHSPLHPLAPRVMEQSRLIAGYHLLQRLLTAAMPEHRLQAGLANLVPAGEAGSGLETAAQTAEARLLRLFTEVFDIDLASQGYLEARQRHSLYDEHHDTFFWETYYQLQRGIREDAHLAWLQTYRVLDPHERVLGSISRDHLYQTFLPGQVHAFQGKPYEVDEILHGAAPCIKVHMTADPGQRTYRAQRVVTLGPLVVRNKHVVEHFRDSSWEVTRTVGEAEFEVATDGYFTFGHGINLTAEAYTLTSLTGRRAVPPRRYRAGRVLRLEFASRGPDLVSALPGVDRHRVAFTLMVLLNELFPSLFPETHRLIFACQAAARRPEAGHRLPELMPRLVLAMPTESAGGNGGASAPGKVDNPPVVLYFFEDSNADVGLVQCLFEDWEGVLHLLYDVLHWMLEPAQDAVEPSRVTIGPLPDEPVEAASPDLARPEDASEPAAEILDPPPPGLRSNWRRHVPDRAAFLKYGQGELDSWIDLTGTAAFLAALFPPRGNHLHESRLRFLQDLERSGPYFFPATAEVCDFCGLAVATGSYQTLDDGRTRCRSCAESAADSREAVLRIHQEARDFLVKILSQPLRQDIEVVITSAREIALARGLPFEPGPDFDPRASGVAIRRGERCAVLVENAQPYHILLSVMVHELTHVWQYDNLDLGRLATDGGRQLGLDVPPGAAWRELVMEGHAQWADLEILRRHPRASAFAAHIAHEEDRTDVYGEGLRLIQRLLADHPSCHGNPFVLFRSAYPR